MSNKSPIKNPAWKKLAAHRKKLAGVHIKDLFAKDTQRFEDFHLEYEGLLLDYSRHPVTKETLALLAALANNVEKAREQMFTGERINTTENRAVLHMALRGSVSENIEIDDENVSAFVRESLAKIRDVAGKIRKDKNITDVVHIGIGGSDLGPRMVTEALAALADGPHVHFVSNIDGTHLARTLINLNPQKTVFIIASKTFTTIETMTNAKSALAWGKDAAKFYAVTANEGAAKTFGIPTENILPLRDWIGGRYSLWSAAGLPIAVSAGFTNFEKLLAGARAMDAHFCEAPLSRNMPVILALLGIWQRNFWERGALAVLPYAQDLAVFPAYIQQLDMESNGKSVDRDGKKIDYATSPVVFGEPGTGSQHAFFQLLHQGTDIILCDFIAVKNSTHKLPGHHTKLLANALAQAKALMAGNGKDAAPHQAFDGNRPSSMIILESLDPYHLGLLLALYEHKIFVQGVIWNVNSFDQWGVELGKKLAKNITQSLENNAKTADFDSATEGALSWLSRGNA
jgi:glucose-6-phosphate isomerase